MARRTQRGSRAADAQRPGATATMIPGRSRRRFAVESVLMRLIATAGIVAVGVVLAAILTSQDVEGWIVGLAVSTVSVVLAAILWSSRHL